MAKMTTATTSMTNAAMREQVQQMLATWDTLAVEQRELATIRAAIAAKETELVVRESAAKHVRGIPARQNMIAIEVLCDELTDLHIARLEAEEKTKAVQQ